jgi:RadC-like JAB domain
MTEPRSETPAPSARARRRLGHGHAVRAWPDSTLIARLIDMDASAGVQFSLRGLECEPGALGLGRGEAPLLAGTRDARAPLTRPQLQRLSWLVELVRRIKAPKQNPTRICSASDVLAWAQPGLVHLEHEELWLLCLDGKNVLTAAERVAQGGLHGCGVTPRDVLRPAVRNGAAAVVVVHNHPSGDPTPSREDVVMTEQLAQACALLGVPLLDHVVVARAGAQSAAVAALR